MKKFKNSFGVTGSETEINFFLKEIHKLGWKYLSFNRLTTLVYFNAKEGEYNYCDSIIGTEEVLLSNASGWNRALLLANEEIEEAPEYVRALINSRAMGFSKGKIYIVYNIDSSFIFINNDRGYRNGFDKSNFEPSTKEAYDYQELLKEAKRRYPVGVIVKSLVLNYKGRIISDDIHEYSNHSKVWLRADGFNALVYEDGIWAEIIPEEKTYTKSEIKEMFNRFIEGK